MRENNPNNRGDITNEYIVAERDTIPELEKKLGLSWKEIWEMNKDVIQNPEELRPGMKLKIPAKTGNY